MSIKSKVLASAAALTLVGGAGLASALTAGTASALTAPAGAGAIELFNTDFGTHHTPNFVLDTLRQGEKVGQPQILFRTSSNDPAEDYTVTDQGTVQDWYEAGLISAAVALHYGCVQGSGSWEFNQCPTNAENLPAFELQYSPYGVDSGLCAGVAATAWSGEKVTLQSCGVSSKTVWIADTSPDDVGGPFNNYAPAINGSNTNFSQPLVLTYPTSAYPTDMPRPELYVSNLSGLQGVDSPLPDPGTVNSNQLFGADYGVYGDLTPIEP